MVDTHGALEPDALSSWLRPRWAGYVWGVPIYGQEVCASWFSRWVRMASMWVWAHRATGPDGWINLKQTMLRPSWIILREGSQRARRDCPGGSHRFAV